MKKIISLVLATALIVTLFTACGSKDEGATTTTGGVTTVTMWTALSGATLDVLNSIAADFNNTVGKEKNINVQVIAQGSYTDTSTKMKAALQAGIKSDYPDIIHLNSNGAFDIKQSPDVVWADDMIAKDKSIDMSKLNKNALQAVTYKGKLLGLPLSNSSIVLYYNKDMFKEAGLDPEKPPVTIADLADYAKKLMKKDGAKITRYGISTQPGIYQLSSWIPMQKTKTFQTEKEDGRAGLPTKVIFDTEGTMKTFLTEWKKVIDTGALDCMDTSPRTSFEAKGTAMYTESMVQLRTLEKNQVTNASDPSKKIDIGIAKFPRVNAESNPGTAIGGSAIFLLNRGNEKTLDAAWEFEKYLTTPDVCANWFIKTGYYPLNNDAYNNQALKDFLSSDPKSQIPLNILSDSKGYEYMQEPWVPSYDDFKAAEIDNIVSLSEGKQDIDTTIKNITEKCNTLLSDYAKSNPEK
ncbi:MAG: ABC transporter substrate-binding protein [Bacillota bacterium]|nr:ABC transporter substrate-binding protein [Bacillota bacterium]